MGGRSLLACRTKYHCCTVKRFVPSALTIRDLLLSGILQEREMLAYCKFKGIGVIPWGPLNGGALSRPVDRTNDTLRGAAKPPLEGPDKVIISRVEELAKKYGKSMTQVALVWATSKVTSPIVGTSSLQRLEENIDIAFELSEEDIKYLEEP